MSNLETTQYVLDGHRLPKPINCPDEVFDLMKLCWNEEVDKRPSFKQIYERLYEILQRYMERFQTTGQDNDIEMGVRSPFYNNDNDDEDMASEEPNDDLENGSNSSQHSEKNESNEQVSKPLGDEENIVANPYYQN